jgi:hypothetical protein
LNLGYTLSLHVLPLALALVPLGLFAVLVYAAIDPVTGKRHYLRAGPASTQGTRAQAHAACR